MSQGHFYVFDGVDGSGKTFLLNAFKQKLIDKGLNVRVFKAIGEGYHGLKLRELILNSPTRMNPISEALIFLAAIKESYFCAVRPFIESGGIALMDRYIYSTFIYQFIYMELLSNENPKLYKKEELSVLLWLVKTLPIPDVSVILEIDKETMISNINNRDDKNILDNFCLSNADDFIQSYGILRNREFLNNFKNHNFFPILNNRPYDNPNIHDENLDKLYRLIT